MTCSVTGANARLAIKEQADLTTIATGNWNQVPFLSFDMAAVDEISDDPVLGFGRDAQRPTRDAITVRGRVTVPADLIASGYWLKGAFGAATVSGSGDITHLFKSGAVELPAFSLEIQHMDAPTPIYSTYRGVMVDSIGVTWGTRGRPRFEIGLVGIEEVEDNTSNAGTPVVISPTWFHHKTSSVKKDTVHLGKIVGANITYSNDLQVAEYVGDAGLVGCIAGGMFSARGSMTARYNELDLQTIAAAGTLFDLEMGWTIGATQALLFEMDQAELVRRGRSIANAGAIERAYDVIASKDFTEGDSVRVTLKNQVTAY
jgi:hypothetical protein